jgi:putative ABC transport system permease protein
MFGERMHDFWLRVKALVRRRELDRDLDDELQFHLAMREQKLREQGVAAEEAPYAARRQFGNVTRLKETSRELWGFRWLESIAQDLRYGLRQLKRNPGFTAVAVVTLALGIGANTAIFSVVNGVLLRPLPYKDPGRLVTFYAPSARNFDGTSAMADWTEDSKTLENISVYEQGEINVTGEGPPEHMFAAEVSEHFFTLFGIPLLQGRTFLPAEEKTTPAQVAVISHSLWQTRYGSDPDLIGESIGLNGKPFTVIGIMPAGFGFPGATQIWIPLPARLEDEMFGGNTILPYQVARLRPGINLEQATSELELIAHRNANNWGDVKVSLVPLHTRLVGDVRPALLLLFAAVGMVLLIACADIVNLLLARGASRFREMAVRSALGGSRARIVRQLLTESLLLSLLGGAVGLFGGWWTVSAIKALLPTRMPFTGNIKIDGWVLLFTFSVAVLTGVFSGLFPAVHILRLPLAESIKESTPLFLPGFGWGAAQRLRSFLGGAQVAIALVLLIGASLLIRSYAHLLQLNPGLRPENLLTARLSLLEQKYSEPHATAAFVTEVLSRAKGLPGVTGAAFSNVLPVDAMGVALIGVSAEGSPARKTEHAVYVSVSSDFFPTMGIPILEGRHFSDDDRQGATSVAIISQSLARRCWPLESAIGRRFSLSGFGPGKLYEVVGIASDARLLGLSVAPMPTMYFPFLQHPENTGYIVVRSNDAPGVLAPALRDIVQSIDKSESISSYRTMDQLLSRSVSDMRFQTALLTIFSGLALLLAIVGIYGVVSYSVSRRTHEVGIRMALGAQRRDVLRLLVGQEMALTFAGAGVGGIAAFALAHLLSGFLYGVQPADPVTFVVAPLVLVAMAFLATFIPALRATKVDPTVALRYQ